MVYNGDMLQELNLYINDKLRSESKIEYLLTTIRCEVNGITYEIFLDNTRGGARAKEVTARVNGALLNNVEYFYDDQNRIEKACYERLGGVDDGGPKIRWIIYTYNGNDIIEVDDAGTNYTLNLSSEENTGSVCNVLDFSGAPISTQYIINPDLYYLNIYGKPVGYLPQGQTIERNSSNNLTRVGKYRYEY